jgi:hypothetical protein
MSGGVSWCLTIWRFGRTYVRLPNGHQSESLKSRSMKLRLQSDADFFINASSCCPPTYTQVSNLYFWRSSPMGATGSHAMTHTAFGRTPLDGGLARRKDLYLKTHNTHKRQTCMPPAGFKPAIPASEGSQKRRINFSLPFSSCYMPSSLVRRRGGELKSVQWFYWGIPAHNGCMVQC